MGDKPLVTFPEVDINQPPRRGYTEVDILENDYVIAWPNCEIDGCENGVCIGMSKSLCYPHGIEFGAFTEEEWEANRAERHRK